MTFEKLWLFSSVKKQIKRVTLDLVLSMRLCADRRLKMDIFLKNILLHV